jgi:hypothetical protein
MARVLKSLQSEGGFSVKEATIIDANRDIIDANSVKVTNVLNTTAFKKEYVAFATLNDTIGAASLEPAHVIDRNKVAFINTFAIGTWDGYPIGEYTINANESIVSISLSGHGLTTGDSIDATFDTAASSANGTYQAVVVDADSFTFDIGTPIDASNPTIGTVEFTSYGRKWEYAIKIESAILTDDVADQTLSIAAISSTIVRDNVPPGHTWSLIPSVNQTTKEFSFQATVSSNGTLESVGTGVRWIGNVSAVVTERD